ncbi:hypothetical protein BsWGS_26459 [Bradybaena similaris]
MNLEGLTENESSSLETDNTTLINIIKSTGDDEALKLLNSGRTFSQEELDMALISACHCGYKFLVCELVRFGADVETKDGNGNTPLLICAENGFTNMARFFIRRQVEINVANYCGNTALMLAIGRSGSVEIVKLLLAQTGINVNHQNREGYTALMKAIEAMNVDVIKLLLDSQKNKAEVLDGIKNCRNETSQEIAEKFGIGKVVQLLSTPHCEPILEAGESCDVDSFNILIDCQCYDPSTKCRVINNAFNKMFTNHERSKETFNDNEHKIIQRLLECGATVNDHYYRLDPILIATKVGSYGVLQLLLENDANFGSSSRRRRESLFEVAAENGRIDLIQLLLDYSSVSELGYSHIKCALKNGHTDCARFLLRQGVNIDIKTALRSAVSSELPELVKFLIENLQAEVRQFALTTDMNNLLISASRNGNLEIIGLLLDAGANVNCVADNKTPLMEAKNAEVIYFLVQRGAVVNKYSRAKGGYSSPLTYILNIDYSYYESTSKETVVEAFLKCGAFVDGKSGGGRTPLMIALSKNRSRRIVQMLLDHGAQSNVRDSKGNTPLLLAARANNTDNIVCLLEFFKYSKESLNAQSYDGSTALMVASKNCNPEVVKHLVSHGADVNITDVSGNTALLHAADNVGDKNVEVLTTLISAGSDINFQNKAGFSPLMLAAENRKPNVVKLLINFGSDVNSVSKTARNITALSVLSNKSYLGQETLDCMAYLLDQDARASYVSPDIVHKLILHSKIELIPKLIQCGVIPFEASCSNVVHYSMHTFLPDIKSFVSPLYVALMTENVTLARYFVANLFMTKSDTSTLVSSHFLRNYLEMKGFTESLDFLDEMSAQPMSLFTLAFVAVQTAVGSAPGHEERVNMLPLPRAIKDRLLFKHEHVKLV